jgi:type II secretory pathway pseudopilin PulG
MNRQSINANGFSMLELLLATAIFMVLGGAIFSVLFSSQLRYQSESGLTNAFQQANIVIDQIVRDVHSTGFPPPNSVSSNATPQYYALPFPWSSGYPTLPPSCTVGNGGTCTIPGDYDLILEADEGQGKVQWIRYSLVGTTLKRKVVGKSPGSDPVAATDPTNEVPFLENVVNGSIPVFSYRRDPSIPDPSIPSPYSPLEIREVNIRLMVQSSQRDPQTQQFRTITLTGRAVAFNANY